MCERWKPEKGETFWWFDFNGRVFQRTYHDDGFDSNFVNFGNMFETEKEAKSAVEKIKALLFSLQEPVTDCNQLPKLTAEVFDREDCPEWAKYAAVCADGSVRVFLNKPTCQYRMYWCDPYSWWEQKLHGVKYDAAYWQNSLIERPEKKQDCSDFVEKIKKSGLIEKHLSEVEKKSYENLRNVKYRGIGEDYQQEQYINFMKNKKSELAVFPEWCKVGEWVYSPCCCDPDKGTYFKVTQIDDVCIIGEDYVCHVDNAVRARLRPYNSEEMKSLVGKSITLKDGAVCLCTAWSAQNNYIILDNVSLKAERILNVGYTLNGKPCGVLEHLNENLEWVE